MIIEKLPLFLLIALVSCINNLFIPFFIYWKRYGLFRKRSLFFIGCNGWGIIMDGILAALINITALNWLLEIKPGFLLSDLTLAVLLGFTSMILNHAIMSILKWNVWIMPRPWHWNAGGYWHMVSMTIQMSFLFFPLIILFNNPPLWQESITQFTLSSITFLTALFGLALYFSSRKKDLKIGPLHISNKPW